MNAAGRLRALVTMVVAVGAAVCVASVVQATQAPGPALWRLALGGALFFLGERAMFHLRFGLDEQSFNWLETSVVVGIVLVPMPWLPLVAGAGACAVHLLRRRPPVKLAFNAFSCATGAELAAVAFHVALGGQAVRPLMTRTWLALIVASFVFFLWNGATVSLAVAYSQGMRFRDVQTRGLILNVLVWLGNTAIGVLIVAIAATQLALLAVLPVLFLLLCLGYRSYMQALRERDTWQELQDASRDLLQVEEAQLVDMVLKRSASLFEAVLVEMLLVDGDGLTSGRAAARSVEGSTEWRAGMPADLAPGLWERALVEQQPFMAANVAVAPLLVQGTCVGVLLLGFERGRSFSRREQQVLATFTNNVSSALHNVRLFAESRRSALHDPLTGLPNRILLLDRLEQALDRSRRRELSVAVLFLDLDRFKVVNDSLGHDVGDALLIAAARRMSSVLRPGDTATRFGGDEFVVVCEDIDSEREAMDIADRLGAALFAPFEIDGREMFVTVSIGVAMSESPDAKPNSLIRDADAAMYLAKSRGRARAEMFDSTLRADAIARLDTENDLRRALDRSELRVFYQPTVDIRSGGVIGFEALVRWQHPDRGLIAPGAFIPLAEETGLISGLTTYVLEETCAQIARWAHSDLPARFTVSMNLCAREVAEPGLVENIARVIRRSGIDPRHLCLEITETALLADLDAALSALERLAQLGVGVALDDFGTGFSSLSYLRRLPVDVLKIDRSFIARLGEDAKDLAVVAGMIDLAHALNLSVVAEGVETTVQLAELERLGCDAAQGWLFAEAQPASEATGVLQRGAFATL